MANNSSLAPIVIDESTYISISDAPERNKPVTPPPKSIVVSPSPLALQIPPRFDDPFINNLFDPDLPISPTSGYTQLMHLGDRLAPDRRAILAQKVAQAAFKKVDKLQGKVDCKQTALDSALAKDTLTHHMWREEVALLQQQLADVQASHDPPTLAGLVRL